jgi:hypothetical protein
VNDTIVTTQRQSTLYFLYNLVVFLPTIIAAVLYFRALMEKNSCQ